jgi:hypothetical protein
VRLPFRELFESNKKRAEDSLGTDAFARAWAEGQAMTPKRAIDYVFEGLRPIVGE